MRIAFSWGSTGTLYGLGTLYTAVPWALSEAHEPQSHSAFICIVRSLKMVTAVSRFSPTVSMEEPPGPWGESTFHGGDETLVPPPSASVGGTGGVPSPWCPHLSRRWQHWFLPAQLGWVKPEESALCFADTWYLNGKFFHFSAPWQSPDCKLSYAFRVTVLS